MPVIDSFQLATFWLPRSLYGLPSQPNLWTAFPRAPDPPMTRRYYHALSTTSPKSREQQMSNTVTSEDQRSGYRVAVLGSALGLVMGLLLVGFSFAVIAGILGLLTPWQLTPNTLLILAEISLLGAPLGCGVALSRARQFGAVKTGLLLAGFLIVAVTATQPTLFELGAETLWSLRILIVLGVLVATCVARGLALVDAPSNAKRALLHE